MDEISNIKPLELLSDSSRSSISDHSSPKDTPDDIKITAAAKIPPEIHSCICDYALNSARFEYGSQARGTSLIDRAAILRVALTCQAWAVQRNQFLFSECYDRGTAVNGADVPDYITLVAQYAKQWDIHDTTLPGWTRRYLSLYNTNRFKIPKDRILHKETRITVHVRDELESKDDTRTPLRLRRRSIFSSCPKSLPPTCIPALSYLKLSRQRFRSFSDLMHLVWELPNIDQIECEYIYYDTFQGFRPPTLRTQKKSSMRVVCTHCGPQCTPYMLLFITSLFKIEVKGASGILSSSDALLLVALLQSFAGDDWGKYDFDKTRMIFERSGNNCEAYIDEPRAYMQFNLERSFDEPVHLRISSLELVVGYMSESDEFNWAKIGRHLRNIPGIQKPFEISLPFMSEEDLQGAAYIVSQLPEMWSMGQLRITSGDRLLTKRDL